MRYGYARVKSLLRLSERSAAVEHDKPIRLSAKTPPPCRLSEQPDLKVKGEEWKTPVPVVDIRKLNLSGMDLFIIRFGTWVTTCVVALFAIASVCSNVTGAGHTLMI